MSGHSKWATTKHQKGAKDAARAKVFAKLIRQIEVAAREGGSDMTANASLRTMYTKARDSSVPIDTIERAIKRGSGELEGVRYESISYEGYAPDGVAVIVECLSDNRNRTGAEIRNLFAKNGGAMAEPGSVSWQFERKGVIAVPRAHDEEQILEVAMEAGGEDLADEGERWLVSSDPSDLMAVRSALEEAGLEPGAPELSMVPTTTVEVASESEAKRVLRLIEALDDHDDVQNVYANFDIPDEVMAAYEG
ncbi:MAG TPA: YebC/PmpR family DNA-binding transcriptional regulator [Acidimicrobiales bacterium]|jgi:YebC/PmpR family DNA-binding regulatory protein|nr:YebC/PmpR family DNA-binding transcriptional regulator [Acidimicrobiales bacterium]